MSKCYACGYESWECHCIQTDYEEWDVRDELEYSPFYDTCEYDHDKYVCNPIIVNTCAHCNKKSVCSTDTNKKKSNCVNVCNCNEICTACEKALTDCECEHVSERVVEDELKCIFWINVCIGGRICDNTKIPTYIMLELDIIKSAATRYMVSDQCTIHDSLLSKYKHQIAIVISFCNLPYELLNIIMEFMCNPNDIEDYYNGMDGIYDLERLPVF